MKETNFISWASVNNWIPLIAIMISTVLTFSSYSTRIALLEQKLDIMQETNREILALLKENNTSYESRIGKLTLKVGIIENMIGLSK